MRFRRQPPPPSEITIAAQRRVQRLSTPEILQWADTAGAGIARALSDHQRDGNPDSLEDAYTGLLTMLGVVEELRDRV